jgi:hypothetical protein
MAGMPKEKRALIGLSKMMCALSPHGCVAGRGIAAASICGKAAERYDWYSFGTLAARRPAAASVASCPLWGRGAADVPAAASSIQNYT